jgi:hypothetical protein
MYRYVMVFPVLADKSDDDAKAISTYFYAHPEEYLESREKAGNWLERAYLQTTPMGSFVVAYYEGDLDMLASFARFQDMSKPLNRRFAELVKEVHGMDITEPMPGDLPETVIDWRDREVPKIRQGMAFTFPLLPGKLDAFRMFAREAFEDRHERFVSARRSWLNNAEVVTLFHSPMDDAVGVYVEGDDPDEANKGFAASQAPFDRWFKGELKKVVSPQIDFERPISGVEEIFDSMKISAKAGERMAFAPAAR